MSSVAFSSQQRRVLTVILVPAFMSLLSVSIVNVTLPAIETTLQTGTSGLQWIVSGYALVFGVLLVSAGRAGDVWGRGKLFVAGLIVFGLGSLAAGLAPSILFLNLARVVMGIGSGLLNPQVTGMIQQFFAGELRGRAFGLFGGVIGVSVAVGPLLGGGLVALLGNEGGWRWSFLVNVPIAVVAVLAARWLLPDDAWRAAAGTGPAPSGRDGAARRKTDFDPVGMVLLALGTLFVMLPFMEHSAGWWVWLSLIIGAALVWTWTRWERRYSARGRTPMVDMKLFRTRSFSNGTLLIGLYFMGYTSIWLLVAQYLQNGLHHTALAAGAIGLPAALAGAVAAPIAGRYVTRVGRVMVMWGLTLVVAGLVLSALVVAMHPHGVSEWWLLLTLGFAGLGQGLVVSPNQTLTLAEVPLDYAGSAGGVVQTGQRLGTAIGIALITSITFSLVATVGWDVAVALGFGVVIVVVLAAMAVGAADLGGTRKRR
ncbi:MAG: MFS transporter [Galactobacter sp.]